MVNPDLVNLLLLPIGLGLLGFIEPCSLGSSVLFIHYVEGKAQAEKAAQAIIFTLTRAVVVGTSGAMAAFVGASFFGFQRAAWTVLGALYVVLGAAYLLGRAGALMRPLGPSLGRLRGSRGAVSLAVLFGLNVPACAGPLLFVILGTAAAGGAAGTMQAIHGFVSLAVFGLALSLPLTLAILWGPAGRALDRLAKLSNRAPAVIGLVLIALGLWSIYLGLHVTPRP